MRAAGYFSYAPYKMKNAFLFSATILRVCNLSNTNHLHDIYSISDVSSMKEGCLSSESELVVTEVVRIVLGGVEIS